MITELNETELSFFLPMNSFTWHVHLHKMHVSFFVLRSSNPTKMQIHLIDTQVPTRSVRELVQYYYAWKMTERFKLFLLQLDEIPLTKFRTDKRKFHSGNG